AIAAGEDTAVSSAAPDGNDPLGVRRCPIRALQRLAHIARDRSRHQKHVSVPWRGDEAQAEALDVIERVVECVDFEFAAIAGAGVDLTDRKTAAEPASSSALDAHSEFGKGSVVHGRRRFGERPAREAFKQRWTHQRSCPEYEQLKDLLQSGKSATILPSMAVSRRGHWNHDGSRKWQWSTLPSSMRTAASTSPRKPSTRPKPSPLPRALKPAAIGPSGRRAMIWSISEKLCSTSRMRIQTRALTSPSDSTGTVKSSLSYGA